MRRKKREKKKKYLTTTLLKSFLVTDINTLYINNMKQLTKIQNSSNRLKKNAKKEKI